MLTRTSPVEGAERVSRARGGHSQAATQGANWTSVRGTREDTGPLLKDVLPAVAGFRKQVCLIKWRLHRRGSLAGLQAFRLTSPLAAYLVDRSGAAKAPLAPRTGSN
ncbi:MAG: hypothetical protein JKY65_13095 [Planctomycetes bacterium]|nr:hypothetical protein [Planctomycetota bacterium]